MRAIVTKYLGPTDSRGSRVKVTDPGYASSDTRARCVYVPWDHALDVAENHAAAARVALQRWEWTGVWVGGGLDTGNCFVCVKRAPELTVYPDGFAADDYLSHAPKGKE